MQYGQEWSYREGGKRVLTLFVRYDSFLVRSDDAGSGGSGFWGCDHISRARSGMKLDRESKDERCRGIEAKEKSLGPNIEFIILLPRAAFTRAVGGLNDAWASREDASIRAETNVGRFSISVRSSGTTNRECWR